MDNTPAIAPGTSRSRSRPQRVARKQSYKLDVHLPSIEACHISSSKARRELKKTHPRRVLRDQQGHELLVHHKVCCPRVGMHKFCCCCGGKCSCADEDEGSGGGEIPSEFGGYGSGVVLWFRFLSCMVFLFFALTVLSAPAALIYSASADWSEVEAESAVDGLWRFTPANLAAAASACAESESAETTLEASCPAGTKISRIEAYFAELQGSCDCPAAQVPAGLECPGVIPRGSSECNQNEYCFYEQSRRAEFPTGSTVAVAPCCAPSLNDASQPNFADLAIRTVSSPECDFTAVSQYIAARVCIGTESCSVTTQNDALQPFIDLSFVDLVGEQGLAPSEALTQSEYCTQEERDMGQQWASENPAERRRMGVAEEGICATSVQAVMAQLGMSQAGCSLSNHRLVLASWCAAEDLDVAGWGDVSRTNAALTLSLFDFFVCLLMLYAAYSLSKNEELFQMFYTQATPADYTVLIENLPPHDSVPELEKRLKAHMEGYLSMCPAVYRNLPGNKVAIADINFGMDDQTLTAVKVKQGAAAQQLQRYVAEMTAMGLDWKDMRVIPSAAEIRADINYSYCPLTACNGYFASWCRGDAEMLACRMELLRNDMARRRRYIKALEADAKKYSFATRAYVTFEEEEGALRALREFPDSYSYALCCSHSEAWITTVQDEETKTTPVRCRRAEEPSDAIWEHQQSSSSLGALLVSVAVFILFVAAVIGAGGAILGIEVAKNNALAEFPNVDCDTITDSGNKVMALQDEYYDVFGQRTGRTGRMGCYCFELLLNSTTNVKAVRAEPFPVPSTQQAALSDGPSVLNFSTAATTGGSFGNRADESQYPLPADWRYEYTCKDWLNSYATATGLTYGGSILIVTINAGMIFFVHFMVKLMELPTKTQEIQYRTVFLFVAQFINTAVITVMINAQIDSGRLRRIAIGKHDDFDSNWYTEVGTSIMLTMILNIFAAQVPHLRDILLKSCARCQDRDCTCDSRISHSPSQVEYEKLQMGPKMRLDELYAIAMNTTYVCFIFSGGLPLLMPVALIFMAVGYLMQLYMFTRVNQTPPQYDNRVALSMSGMIPYAVVMHLLISAWMFSEYDIFPALQPTDAVSSLVEQSSQRSAGAEAESILQGITVQGIQLSQRLWRTHVIPLVLLAVLLTLVLALRLTVYTVIKECCNGMARCCTGHDCSDDYEPEYLHNYFDALPLSTLLSYVGPKADRNPRSHMRHKLVAAMQRRTKQLEEKSITLQQAMQNLQQKKHVLQTMKLDLSQRVQAQAGIRYQIQRQMQMEQATGQGGSAILQQMHEDLEHVGADIDQVQSDMDAAMEDVKKAQALVTMKRNEARRRSTVQFISTEVDGEKIEGMFVEDDENDAKIMMETHELSYCLDESVEYRRKFGYDVSSTIKDPDLLQDFNGVLPSRSSGTMAASARQGGSGGGRGSQAHFAMQQAIAESRLEAATQANTRPLGETEGFDGAGAASVSYGGSAVLEPSDLEAVSVAMGPQQGYPESHIGMPQRSQHFEAHASAAHVSGGSMPTGAMAVVHEEEAEQHGGLGYPAGSTPQHDLRCNQVLPPYPVHGGPTQQMHAGAAEYPEGAPQGRFQAQTPQTEPNYQHAGARRSRTVRIQTGGGRQVHVVTSVGADLQAPHARGQAEPLAINKTLVLATSTVVY